MVFAIDVLLYKFYSPILYAYGKLQIYIHMYTYMLYIWSDLVMLSLYSNNRCFTDGINGLAKALQVNDTLKQLKVPVCMCLSVCLCLCVCVCVCCVV